MHQMLQCFSTYSKHCFVPLSCVFVAKSLQGHAPWVLSSISHSCHDVWLSGVTLVLLVVMWGVSNITILYYSIPKITPFPDPSNLNKC